MPKPWTKKSRWIALVLILGVVVITIVRTQFFWVTMESTSMNSSGVGNGRFKIHAGDDVVVSRSMRHFLKKGDLAVVALDTESNGNFTPTVRRIAGIPGHVYRNDTNESKIPDGYYYVTGDSTNALDSRQLGVIKKNQIFGKVIWVMPGKNSKSIAYEP